MALRTKRTLAIAAIVTALVLDLAWVGVNLSPTSGAASCLVPPAPCMFDIHGEIFIGTNDGGGMMNITVSNLANFPLTDIRVLDAGPGITGLVPFTPFTFDGVAVSDSNQLAIGQLSNGFYQFTAGGSSGTSYTVTVQVTMANGQTVTEK